MKKKVKHQKRERDPLKNIMVTLPGLPGGIIITDDEPPRRTVASVEFTPDWEEFLPNPFKEI